ncbi:MAG: class I SAM-dependent methyltransferase [Actinobacteria bacterium]|nr:class I SAM-dependent methyltransferase [Actinomycetota bacterium]
MIDNTVEIILADGPKMSIGIDVPGNAGDGDLVVRIEGKGKAVNNSEKFGAWTFKGAPGGTAELNIEWLSDDEDKVSLLYPESDLRISADEKEHEIGAVIWPSMVASAVRGEKTLEIPIRVTDAALLEKYYQLDSHQEEYRVEHPFLDEFHEARLRVLGHMFRKYIKPGSRVLDVGSGYSIFYMVSKEWNFNLTCCDLDSAAMEKMRKLAPDWNWIVANALELPWDDESFDAVYAGEIIEHVNDPEQAMKEWTRVLAPGGVLILSTPNRDRLLARANREAVLVHHEHIHEMNMKELKAIASRHGYKVLKTTGIYLELGLNWYRPRGVRVDMLIRLFTDPKYRPMFRFFCNLGRFMPRRAYDLVIVCRKK